MALSSVSVMGNALLLKRWKMKQPSQAPQVPAERVEPKGEEAVG